MDLKNSKALSMLLNYDSDSDKDSGYTSEEEKKRKHNFLNPREKRNKKMRVHSEEDMLVDGENFSWCCNETLNSKEEMVSSSQSAVDSLSRKLKIGPELISSDFQENISEPKRVIPLPKELGTPSHHLDDPSLHQGRIRSFPHERGNWASIIYIPLTFGAFYPHLNSLVAVLITTCNDSDLEAFQCSDYHVSLSQTFILRLEWIQPLVEDLKRRLLKFRRFSLCLHGLAVFTNNENTRTFLALKVVHGKKELGEISNIAAESLKKYKLSALYEDCSFHVSVAWCYGNKSDELKKLLPQLQNVCDHCLSAESEMATFDVIDVHVKTGNRIQTIPFSQA